MVSIDRAFSENFYYYRMRKRQDWLLDFWKFLCDPLIGLHEGHWVFLRRLMDDEETAKCAQLENVYTGRMTDLRR